MWTSYIAIFLVENTGIFFRNISAINETTLTVTFEDGVTVTNEDLQDAKIALTTTENEEEVTLEATFVSLAEDGKTANFVLSGENKLVDAAQYMLSSDVLAFKNAGLMPKIATAYAKTFEAVTSDVIEGASAKVYFDAKNQYEEAFDLSGNAEVTFTATLNGMPLSAAEIDAYVAGTDYININHAVKENDDLVINLANKNGEKSQIAYTVIKGEAPALQTLSLEATETNIAFGEESTLTLTARDQYNNPFSVAGTVRWFIDGVETDASTNGTLTLDSALYAKQGTHTVKAFYANDTKKSAEITINVGASKLDTLTINTENPATTYNLDEIVAQKITGTEGAILTADMLKFNVVAEATTVEGITAEDVTVTAKVRGGEEADKDDIIITVKSTKPGKYTVTPYVGETFNDAKTVKASDFVVTTTVDQTIESIDDVAFTSAELKTGKDLKKTVTFRNKHGEEVVPEADDVNVSVIPVTGLTAVDAVTDGKYEITFNATEAKSYQVVISTGDLFKAYTLNFVAPKFSSLEVGKDITGVVAGDLDAKAKYQEVKFFDQDGQAMSVAKSNIKVSVVKPDGTELAAEDLGKLITIGKTYSVAEDGTVTFAEAALDTDNVAAVKILPNADLAQGKYTVKVSNVNDTKVFDSFAVTVGEARKITTLEASTSNTTLTVGSTQKVVVTPKDQYGDFILADITATSSDETKATVSAVEAIDKDGNVTADDAAKVAYRVTLTGVAKGSANVSFKVGETILATTSVTVDSVGQLVDHIAFDSTEVSDLYSTEAGAAEIELLSLVKAYNASNVEIPVSESNIGLSVVSVNTTSGTANATITDGTLSVDQDFVGTVTVAAQVGTKSTTLTLNFDKAAASAVKGTTVIKDVATVDADSQAEGIQVALDGQTADGEADGAIALQLNGTDQYGNVIAIDFDASQVSIVTDDSSVVTVAKDATANTLTLTSKAAGTANVIINYNGDTITLNVTVTAEGVAALPQG